MTRQEKLELHSLFLGLVCIYGNFKKTERWACKNCTKRYIDTPESKSVDDACDHHLMSVKLYLEMIKGGLEQRTEN